MSKRCAAALAVLFVLFILPPQVEAQETSGGFTGGSIRIGYDNRTCNGALEGSIRYNSASSCGAEFCHGTAWTCPDSASGNCTQIGNVCSADDTVYIGDSPLDGQPLYATRCDHGRTWDGLKCVGDPSRECWDNCSDTVTTNIGYTTNGYDGHFNTAAIVNTDADTAVGFQNHNAPKLCRDLTVHGYSDWYMPSVYEMQLIRDAHTLIGDIDRTGYPYAYYWISAEVDSTWALTMYFKDPDGLDANIKSYGPGSTLLRCIRKPAATSSETAPTGCASVGNVCSDSTVYAGDHPNLPGTKLYVPAADQSTSIQWSSVSADTAADSNMNGAADQAWIAHNATLSQYPAMQLCENLTNNGHGDWYLPSRDELNRLYTNRAAIGGFTTGTYWSSTESSSANAQQQSFNTGTQSTSAKTTNLRVRCVRKGNFD
ncbi:hypothetical protein JOH52_000822 [Sinorhizobium meliloti]|uniref:Lcl domain-containing protein n=1 Tax=Rhizobium meliloti TaxID=382 RepID=UPI000D13BEB2|nr:DUF1566 domain-containing protein [Sinorhizobium meliloti]MBP2464801.1 hypothetical protein [Sinorhizobium meliloti]MQW83422.1 DUF1566 domain-containing protein [Sinorhizobium meliloti]PST29510.1 hypothetical protein C7U62_02670 [Mesorhizobium loti]GEC36475.1 hypothetical protein EME01_05470 [Sinorhizobium meliloti]